MEVNAKSTPLPSIRLEGHTTYRDLGKDKWVIEMNAENGLKAEIFLDARDRDALLHMFASPTYLVTTEDVDRVCTELAGRPRKARKWIPKIVVTGFLIILLLDSFLSARHTIPFDTAYEVTYTNVAGQEITKVIDLPAGINGLEVVSDEHGYNLFVVYDKRRQREMIQPAVIDWHSFSKLEENE